MCTCRQGFTGDGITCQGISRIKLSNEKLHKLRPIFIFVCLHQILMSVLQIPGHVMITPIVLIPTALTAVAVNWVSLVMERLVQVH